MATLARKRAGRKTGRTQEAYAWRDDESAFSDICFSKQKPQAKPAFTFDDAGFYPQGEDDYDAVCRSGFEAVTGLCLRAGRLYRITFAAVEVDTLKAALKRI